MKLIKGKVPFIRSIFGCFIFPLVIGYFYTYLNPSWFVTNQWIGVVAGVLLIARGVFEEVMAKNKKNAKYSFFCGGIIILYVIARQFGIL
ncbi:hypothetical protein [Clostridium sp. LIBA-8841]|uniref:hypothetical protein n=1 Tax=Clostridium sp. LIBA-8841 TaxID=2987530 RepID=UPI002AC454B3|nr:hypothetical protein [Clostridium sp. LIBA-8841]MDZ5252299.1 hypothetical protein [Clostridium sp. LIBA-8841]